MHKPGDEVSFWSTVAIGIGAVVDAGIFALLGQACEHHAARKPVRESSRDGGNGDIADHLDGEYRAEHDTRPVPSKVVREKAECHRCQAGSEQGNDLREEQMPVGSIGEDGDHRTPLSECLTVSLNSDVLTVAQPYDLGATRLTKSYGSRFQEARSLYNSAGLFQPS